MKDTKAGLQRRLMAEGRWEDACAFREQVRKELRDTGVVGFKEAAHKAWEEMERFFPPLVVEEPKSEEDPPEPEAEEAEAAAADASFGLLPASWPSPLPDTATWKDELEWAYQNGFFVIAEKATGAVQYHWDRARTPPPSQGALVLMKLQAESRQKFMDLLGKAKSGGDDDETEGVRREKRSIAEIEAMLQKLQEAGL